MAPKLRVDPGVLRSAADGFNQIGAALSGANIGQGLSGLTASLPGLVTGGAAEQAATLVDDAVRHVGNELSQLSTNLGQAADKYEKTDAELGKKLDKTVDDPNKKDDDGTKKGEPGPAPATGAGPQAIPVDQVTYDNGNWPSGADATRTAINQALDQRGVTDPAARQRWIDAYMTLTQHESSYNPMAVNNWDINAKPPNSTYKVSDGSGNGCSRGLAQCVPGTFARYHQPGTSNDIYDPVANIAASMNYLVGNYGVAPDGSDILAKIPQANPGVHQGY
ncbi:type VII secretion target [Mycobacterium sp. 852013-50091_SCH5140682]|uniref:type VII secretion target n=1 Tax=Mycobacterium sp. 852013-50091_SCH5140682 TaxID=1834109 RepID=UPI0009ED4376|nr:type VII secretion target [Mycobacterium sp. 852013-50091_SCH5140682]